MGWNASTLFSYFYPRHEERFCKVSVGGVTFRISNSKISLTLSFIVFCLIPLPKLRKNSKNSYFSDFECIFCYLGVFAQNVPFIKKNSSCKRIFLRPILTCANTPNRFYGFISNFSNICFPYLYLFG